MKRRFLISSYQGGIGTFWNKEIEIPADTPEKQIPKVILEAVDGGVLINFWEIE